MKHGDLSNISGTVIAFSCDDIIQLKEATFKDIILNKVVGGLSRCELNNKVLLSMEHLYYHTSCIVDIVVTEPFYNDYPKLREFLESKGVPFRSLIVVKDPLDINVKLRLNTFSYYVDSDSYRRNLINSPYAVTIEYINNLFCKRRRF